MNFCSNCGNNKLEYIIPEGDQKHRFVCNECDTIHYQNPRIIAGCLPIYDGKILLGKRAIEPRYGYWNLPAGFLENGETPNDGALRELYEETHAKGEAKHLHTVFSLPNFNQVYLIYYVALSSDEFSKVTSESIDVELFEIEDIPWDSIAFESTTFAIKKYIENPTNTTANIGHLIKEKLH
ncbi:NUDIX hydrolase [Flammeovirga kamogawensis]|uniref:NUDIX hydrolase n=1 Tax=Flammeovirga kamogawensis TaxID=373891 RepID=A0ABX8GY97_9BACT|nr:NUDIX hydrolase [Flammeovirga kamogawensis]MBB6459016.1 ADP-ribose pyrophosphatase YjhB (NUDIX family) [Flammeovirga kamogawensis]QWG08589.1 NUDIX hydrolase [Flammeovirga kamogawensis]TRX66881.1 NUDIX hydrolase [Flammeovirga kamogawensis]